MRRVPTVSALSMKRSPGERVVLGQRDEVVARRLVPLDDHLRIVIAITQKLHDRSPTSQMTGRESHLKPPKVRNVLTQLALRCNVERIERLILVDKPRTILDATPTQSI